MRWKFKMVRIIWSALFLLLCLLPAAVGAQEASTPTETQKFFEQAIAFKKDNQFLKAQDLLRQIVHRFPDSPEIPAVVKELESLNLLFINTNIPSPDAVWYVVRPGETLHDIARRYQITVEVLKRRNGLVRDIIQPGTRLSIWKGPFTIYINKSLNNLKLVNNNRIIKKYRVATGKQNTTTPEGEFTITSKMMYPIWFHRGVIVPPGTPENFLGTRWLGFDKPKYGIHGTIYPEKIGQSVSSGCVRMRNEDVEEMYELIPYGTKVIIEK